MRKIIPYILILLTIISAGLLNPSRVSAETACHFLGKTNEKCIDVSVNPAAVKLGDTTNVIFTLKENIKDTKKIKIYISGEIINPHSFWWDTTNASTLFSIGKGDSIDQKEWGKALSDGSGVSCKKAQSPTDCFLDFRSPLTPTKEDYSGKSGTFPFKYQIILFSDDNEITIDGTFKVGVTASAAPSSIENAKDSRPSELGCDLNPLDGDTNIPGCIAEVLFVFWQASALVAEMAGRFLDFFVYYSTNDASYRNPFIAAGWGAVRDVANIFFIIALLYVAIKIVLSLDTSGSKKMIGNVIIVALLINFSLFTTQIVIDSSNVLAKIFYNNIASTEKGKTDSQVKPIAATGAGGEKSISIGIISKFDPHTIVDVDLSNTKDNGIGTFIFVTILALFITLYTAYIFFSVAVLFLARVVSLWMSMIFSPLAFISYALPFEMPGFGHKEWWTKLLENAFLAPLFIFFLYIIILFTDFLKGAADVYPTGIGAMQKLMGTVIPFAIIAMLLSQAKKLAVKYSGEMGAMLMKGASMVGGLALGVATGGAGLALRATASGAALAGRASLGRMGSAIANSKWARNREIEGKFGGAAIGKIAKSLGSSNFDVRGVKIAGKSLASTTGMNVGEAHKGGYVEARKENVAKKVARAKELELGEDSEEVQEVRRAQISLQRIKTEILPNGARRQDEIIELNNGRGTQQQAEKAKKTEEAAKIDMENKNTAVTTAKTDLATANTALAANPADATAIAAQATAQAVLTTATNNQTTAQTTQTATIQARNETKGLASLDRDVTAAEKLVATAVMAVKDAVDDLAAANANVTTANTNLTTANTALAANPKDATAISNQQAAQSAHAAAQTAQRTKTTEVENAKKDRDAHIKGGTLSNGQSISELSSQEGTRRTKLNRETALRDAEGPIKDAENAEKLAKNKVTVIDAATRKTYADTTIKNNIRQTLSFMGGGGGAGQQEAYNKILAGIEDEKKVTPSSH